MNPYISPPALAVPIHVFFKSTKTIGMQVKSYRYFVPEHEQESLPTSLPTSTNVVDIPLVHRTLDLF